LIFGLCGAAWDRPIPLLEVVFPASLLVLLWTL